MMTEKVSGKRKSRYQKARNLLIFWCLFIGIGAVWGAACMFLRPDGSILQMQEMLPYFSVLPFSEYLFQDYIFSGISLLIVNGLTNLTAAFFLFRRKPLGNSLGMLFGITLMLWITIQFIIFPANILSISYFIFGLAQAFTGFACCTFYRQEHFSFDVNDYPEINPDSRTLVLYFSRMGYVRKKAYETANTAKAAIYEVKALEPTEGTLGFWWCGRFGMHAWPMKIEPLGFDPAKYEHLIICTPIWVFRIASPIRELCNQLHGRVKKVSYVLVHFERFRFLRAADEMNRLLGTTAESVQSVCCKRGKYL